MKKKSTLIFLFCFAILGELFSQSAICSYKYRKRIRFDPTKVGAAASVTDLTNFPVLINTQSDADLSSATGHVTSANGYDIVFTADDGVTLLNFQMERYTTAGIYTAWVKIPTLSTSIYTYIYMYYGNSAIVTDQSTPSVVWSNYYGVYHLQNGAVTTDASGNSYTLTDNSTSSSNAQINKGRSNDGTDWLEVANTFPNITTSFTMSGWMYTNDNTKTGQRMFCDDVNNTGGYALSLGDPGTGKLRFYSRSSTPVSLDCPANIISNNTWYYVTAVADMTGLMKYIYVNGALITSASFTGAWGTDAGNSSIAGETATGETANRLNGIIDEVHIAKTALTADWLLTEYNNQGATNDYSAAGFNAFYTITAEPKRWVGGTNTQWSTGTNWSPAGQPAVNDDVIITNGTNQPTLNVAPNQLSGIWIQSGATLSLSTFTLGVKFDVTNCGTITGNTGTLTMNSTASDIQNQNLSGSGTFNLNNLTVNNVFSPLPKLILNKDVNVTGVLTLTSGITYTTATNILALSSTSSATSGSSSSFVDGPIKKTGNSAFIFPVGSGTVWARIAIGAPGVVTDAFTATYHFYPYASPLPVTAPLSYVSYVEHWILDRTTGTSNVAVTLYWESGTRSGINTFSSDLRVDHYTTANTWVDEGSVLTGAVAAGTVTSAAAVTSFSPFTFASLTPSWLTNPLPIELLNFNANVCNNDVCLDWTTATETNNDYFTVERSQDGVNFTQLGIVDGAGTSTSVRNYSLVDNFPYSGVSYYRLKQTDNNGASTYSNIEMVNFTPEADFSFNVFPNPNNGDNINIAINASKGQEVLVVVYAMTGKESYSKVIVINDNGDKVFAIDPSGKLAPGIYMITATSQESIYSKKMIVK